MRGSSGLLSTWSSCCSFSDALCLIWRAGKMRSSPCRFWSVSCYSTSCSNWRSLRSKWRRMHTLSKMQNMQKPRKHSVLAANSTSTTSSALYSVCVVLACNTKVKHPNDMQNRAVRSYLAMKTSPKTWVDRIVAATIPVTELAPIRVRSRYYSMNTCKTNATFIPIKPQSHFQVQYTFADWSTSCSTEFFLLA